jgi:hypothetical protein
MEMGAQGKDGGMKVNIHYSSQIAVGVAWLYFSTYYRLHVTLMIPWISIEIGLFKRRGVKTRAVEE